MRPSILLSFSTLVAVSIYGPSSYGVRCGDVNSPLRFTERLADKSGTRVMAFNLMNLMDKVGAYDQTKPYQFVKRKESYNKKGEKMDARPKTEAEQTALAEPFHDTKPDFAIVTEVENIHALQTYTQKNLRDAYDSFLIEGNDPRGIDIGLIVKKGLKVEVESRTNKDQMWHDPVTNQDIKLFSRDLPVWIIKDAQTKKPMLALVGMHAKSKRNRDGDQESNIWRTAQMKGAAKIIENLSKELGEDIPLLWGGDFNTDVQTSKEVQPIKALFKDSFDVARRTLPTNKRITHTFHPQNGPTDAKQMDAIFVRNTDSQKIEQANIYRYKDTNGKTMDIPQSYHQREMQPSDHFPVIVDLKFQD